MSKLKVLDLFSGIGGFSLGLERTGGFETAAFCEFDKKARLVLNKHWPDIPMFDDVRTLTKEKLDGQGISVDVICGGFPCQDISLAGKGAGLAGERSGLWFEFHRLIKEIKPSWVIAENVSALRSRGLDTVLRSLSEIGYDAEWHCIPASAVGAPHRRDRIWIIAYPNSDSLNWGSESQLSDNSSGETVCDEFGGIRSDVANTTSQQQQRYQSRILREQGWQSTEIRRKDLRQKDREASSKFIGSSNETLANSSIARLPQRGRSEQQKSAEETGTGVVSEPERRSSDVADPNNARLQRWQETGNFGSIGTWIQQFIERRFDSIGATWAVEPDVGRVAHGVPKRVDRLKQLGNAVVPQIPELIGYAILENIKNGTP